ncbi:MAG: BON domain-containing protein [Woeseiaceae bacterium]
MRKLIILSSLFVLSGCTALAIGGAGVVGYQLGKDERPPNVVASDSAITSKIKGKFVADDVVSVFDIGVRTYEATVTLSGAVGSYNARRRAESLARETGGVRAVNNQITIEDHST